MLLSSKSFVLSVCVQINTTDTEQKNACETAEWMFRKFLLEVKSYFADAVDSVFLCKFAFSSGESIV